MECNSQKSQISQDFGIDTFFVIEKKKQLVITYYALSMHCNKKQGQTPIFKMMRRKVSSNTLLQVKTENLYSFLIKLYTC